MRLGWQNKTCDINSFWDTLNGFQIKVFSPNEKPIKCLRDLMQVLVKNGSIEETKVQPKTKRKPT